MLSYKERVLRHYASRRAEGYRPKNALSIAKFDAKYAKGGKCPFDNRWGYEGKKEHRLPNGMKLVFEIKRDDDCGPPDKEYEGCGETEWVHRTLEDWERDWVLVWDRGSKLLYDVKASMEKALRDGWDAAPYGVGTKHERAARAVKKDFDYLHGYYNEKWWYVGIIVELYDENDNLIDEDSCWGYSADDMSHLTSEARSWAAHMVRKALPTWKRERRIEREESHWSAVQELCA